MLLPDTNKVLGQIKQGGGPDSALRPCVCQLWSNPRFQILVQSTTVESKTEYSGHVNGTTKQAELNVFLLSQEQTTPSHLHFG